MNVVFLSPNFPEHFYLFCARLKGLGVNVLGIGDAPYGALAPSCVNAVTEYYYLPSLEDYDAVYRAVAYYIHRYGRVDYIESQNEYWLPLESRLREDFNIANGMRPCELENVKYKSRMKQYYAVAKVPTARYELVESREQLRRFVDRVGTPVVIKPDSGVGAADSWKIRSAADLDEFWANKRAVTYIAEEYVKGRVETFDGIVNARGEILFATGQVMLVNPLEMANEHAEATSYTTDVRATGMYEIGERVLKAFDIRGRFFHLEFFRLLQDQPGLGRQGEVVGLEVNLRAPGGYIPDKMNYAYDVDVYQIWAESLVYQENRSFHDYEFKYYVAHIGRRPSVNYAHTVGEIRARYGARLVLEKEPPKSLNSTMGAYIFLLRSTSVDELREQREFILAHN